MNRIITSCKTLAVAAMLGLSASASAQTPPPLNIPVATLDAAFTCTGPSLTGATKTPILLVHGTATTPEHNWGPNYLKVLPTKGHPVCTVTLPDKSLADMQVNVEYVVHAVRKMYTTSGRKISMIGHSQGGVHIAWALKFWSDLPAKVDDVIGIAAPFQGSTVLMTCVSNLNCSPAAWQLRANANYVAALNRTPMPAGPSYTSIFTYNDELIVPEPHGSTINDGVTMAVQSKCPGRVVGHIGMAMDAMGYYLAMDALNNPGPANMSRVSALKCVDVYLPGSDLVAWNSMLANGLIGLWSTTPSLNPAAGEPPLRSYAQ
ncbi:esterase/lipase family protein [Noviherbaspirillum saxi]|uniref:Lipase n=1 Tax=Noviherbaspirillum saxi TaxID=2320863 RepID=A0A3A3FLY3_9BURK|nr:hypothetical protein [Noviherbaspirillum saxi]RJF95731.1 hypothetical protein D3871_20340 [Noviherbaspirillum saxi]